MERSWVSNRDRATALVAVVLVHGALFAALLTLGAGRAIVAQIDPLLDGSMIALVAPSFTTNGEHDEEREAEAAARIVSAWRNANPKYAGFVARIRADKKGSSHQGAAS